MSQVILSTNAVRNLDRLQDFLREKSPATSRRMAQAIKKTLKTLIDHPQIGHVIDEMPDDYREIVIKFGKSGYLARYRFDVDTDTVIILAIKHQLELDY